MEDGDGDFPGYGDSGYDNFPSSQPWRSSPTPPPNQMWSPQSLQYRVQSSSHQQRNVVRQQSGFGDYQPNMDAINNPPQHFQSSQFQYTQSPLSESDRFTWEQLMGTPETPTSRSVEVEAGDGGGRTGGGRGRGRNGSGGGRRGGGRSGRRRGGDGEQGPGGSGSRGGGRGGGARRGGVPYNDDESLAVARAWEPPSTMSRRQCPQGQQAAIREARTASQVSAGTAPITGRGVGSNTGGADDEATWG
ncbi:RNA-binding protein FUS-like [Salvia splendens]|uniref:RNA-binding protein FUS-like n=1 Tax=Salvia splendens TaxID=180675 RepID=UPI001C27BF33|nr:RNA-binding protein FUS-like [Salvia splendens]